MMLAYLKTYLTMVSTLLLLIGAVNLGVDPLWYNKGNKLNQVNVPYNERLTKTNLFLHSARQKYDCVIFGSSRVTLLGSKALKNNFCFNYSFSAATSEEIAKYAQYVKDKGINPKKVYVGIDAYNFTFDKKTSFKNKVEVAEPKPIYQPYIFSIDTLQMSLKTVFRLNTEIRFYDGDFQGKIFENAPKYKPKLSNQKTQEKCNFQRIAYYRQIRNIFPNAKIIGYVPPISVWKLFNESYARGLLDCQLQAIYEASKTYDLTYDFSYPSEITIRTDNTYDGSHYHPDVNNQIARVLEGEQAIFGIPIHQYRLNEYQQFHKNKLKEFLQKQGEVKRL
ncbi:MAG: hypothetical protein RMX96_10450 [Nostoc sp. ChiSLP02]|nr:hypothetical protein [Nostoc sp. DedSLP05]MDZ8101383.1 hypothetical protein [Nostoc sp. DedSLP01]MDZ8185259.1 hypothetical protein [Nostoc sp. ChiSLP02]